MSIAIHKIMKGRLWNKKQKNIEKMFNKIGPKIEPWGTQDIYASNSLCLLFFEHTTCKKVWYLYGLRKSCTACLSL